MTKTDWEERLKRGVRNHFDRPPIKFDWLMAYLREFISDLLSDQKADLLARLPEEDGYRGVNNHANSSAEAWNDCLAEVRKRLEKGE